VITTGEFSRSLTLTTPTDHGPPPPACDEWFAALGRLSHGIEVRALFLRDQNRQSREAHRLEAMKTNLTPSLSVRATFTHGRWPLQRRTTWRQRWQKLS
jgi:hypothetical protein